MSDDVNNVGQTPTGGLVGKTIGQYKILKELGRGGMATVYLAEQPSIGRTVAIKVMPQHFLHDPSFMERFRREVQTIARLQHPRILPIHDYGQFDEMPYIVMAYMGAGTLSEEIMKGPMELDDIVRFTNQIAEALDHAHRNGVIHRDFKPSNVLLDENGYAYLADFGIAKISEATVELTGNAMVGTPAYMAPEMADGGDVTPAVDVYALGISLYQMLTGVLPYQGETPIRLLMAHSADPIPNVGEVRENLPPGVAAVVIKALAKRPADRYQSAGELAQAFDNAVLGIAQTEFIDRDEVAVESDRTVIETPDDATYLETPAPSHTPSGGIVAKDARTAENAAVKARDVVAPPEAPPKKRSMGFGLIALIGGGALVALVLCIGILLVAGVLGSGGGGGGQPDSGQIVIQNDATEPLCYLFVSDDKDQGWGPDQLGDNVIQVDDSYTLNNIPNGTYDLKVETCDQAAVEQLDIVIADDVFTWAINQPVAVAVPDSAPAGGGSNSFSGDSGPAFLIIENRSGLILCYLYVSPTTADEWGPEQFGSTTVVNDGEDFTLTDIAPGSYDLRVETCDEQSAEQYDADLTESFTWTITP